MDAQATKHSMFKDTIVERKGDRELVATRLFDASPALVYRAWAEADLFRQWWVPEGFGIRLVGCEMDVRTGGKYRLEFDGGTGENAAFHGKYLDVVPGERIVWTNDENGEEAGAVTTVTFADEGGKTRLTYHELYPTPAELEEALQGSAQGLPAQLDQLGVLLQTLG
ncbi:SRPBCC family protein [Sphingomonas swuensis]|uniref:SRPBCC family protein n=1 Tax=Sphingomonas swuensis TaxID=977800 RepID=A0ABP7SEJ2_9SPHN